MKHLKQLLFISLISFVSASFAFAADELVIHKDTTHGFEIGYPGNWQKVVISDSAVGFRSAHESDKDVFRENVTITVQDLSKEPLTLDDYTHMTEHQVLESLENSKILESKNVTWADQPSHRMIYRATVKEQKLQYLQLWIILGKKAYLYTYTAVPSSYKTFLPQAKAMADSFKLV